jgi:predicted transcriptional regulator
MEVRSEAMSLETSNIQLPDEIYRRLRQMATATHQPLEAVIVQTIRGNLPPALEDLQPELQDLVAELEQLGDDAVWAVARTTIPPARWRWHQRLLQKVQGGTLTEGEQAELDMLRSLVDREVLRRSYALALLKKGGFWQQEAPKCCGLKPLKLLASSQS